MKEVVMITAKHFVLVAVFGAAALQTTFAWATRVEDARDRWIDWGQQNSARQALWQDANASIITAQPASVQVTGTSRAKAEPIAYWGPYRGWYGPGYRYGYWGPPPYRYYYRYGVPYNAYYNGYPDYYYYGPRVGVRVYPYGGRVWGGYW
jgi:hypothetical protein